MPNSGTYGVSWGKGGQLERAQRGQLGRGHSYHALFNPRSGRTFCHFVEVIEKYWNRKLETQLGKGVGWKASIRTLLCVQYSPRRYPIISPFLPKRASPARTLTEGRVSILFLRQDTPTVMSAGTQRLRARVTLEGQRSSGRRGHGAGKTISLFVVTPRETWQRVLYSLLH